MFWRVECRRFRFMDAALVADFLKYFCWNACLRKFSTAQNYANPDIFYGEQTSREMIISSTQPSCHWPLSHALKDDLIAESRLALAILRTNRFCAMS
ncbi:MAG: hypothetical protein IPM82_07240 [Saprospiraceae bacterium]|nr:hypothetical protein [Saprospiraceae bacterium]